MKLATLQYLRSLVTLVESADIPNNKVSHPPDLTGYISVFYVYLPGYLGGRDGARQADHLEQRAQEYRD